MKKVKRYRKGDVVDVAPDDSGGGGGGAGVSQGGGYIDAGRQALEKAGGINPFAIIGSSRRSDSGPAWATQKPEDAAYEANALQELRANKALNGGVTTGILRPGLGSGGGGGSKSDDYDNAVFKRGGAIKNKAKANVVKKMAKGGSISSASKRADGCAQRGKTKGRFV
jgi:hypothetical protein